MNKKNTRGAYGNGERSQKQNSPNSREFDNEVVKDFLDIQKSQIQLDREKFEAQKIHIKGQTEIAKKSIEIQADLLKNAPAERRKDRGQLLIYGTLAFVIIMAFATFCLIYNHNEFLKYLIGAITHLVAVFLGYFFGHKKDKNSVTSPKDYDDAEIV